MTITINYIYIYTHVYTYNHIIVDYRMLSPAWRGGGGVGSLVGSLVYTHIIIL